MNNSDRGLSNEITEPISNTSICSEKTGQAAKATARVSARELHKYVMGLVSVFVLMLITYPIAIERVTQQGKFATERSHVKSLSLEYQPLDSN
jgi:hypothetical protein